MSRDDVAGDPSMDRGGGMTSADQPFKRPSTGTGAEDDGVIPSSDAPPDHESASASASEPLILDPEIPPVRLETLAQPSRQGRRGESGGFISSGGILRFDAAALAGSQHPLAGSGRCGNDSDDRLAGPVTAPPGPTRPALFSRGPAHASGTCVERRVREHMPFPG